VPTYSYACTECDNRFDAVQAFTDDALTACPQCEGRLRKLFNSVGVVFKGSGFYRTDSRESGLQDRVVEFCGVLRFGDVDAVDVGEVVRHQWRRKFPIIDQFGTGSGLQLAAIHNRRRHRLAGNTRAPTVAIWVIPSIPLS
jgi:putative FmdB family regulatory protein